MYGEDRILELNEVTSHKTQLHFINGPLFLLIGSLVGETLDCKSEHQGSTPGSVNDLLDTTLAVLPFHLLFAMSLYTVSSAGQDLSLTMCSYIAYHNGTLICLVYCGVLYCCPHHGI